MTVPGGSPLCAFVLRVVPGARRAPQHNVLVVADGRLVVCGGEEACSHPPLPSLRPCCQRMVDCRGSDACAARARPARSRELTVRVVMPEWHHLRLRGRTAVPAPRQNLERLICLAARPRRRLEALAGGGVVVACGHQAAAVAVRIHRCRHLRHQLDGPEGAALAMPAVDHADVDVGVRAVAGSAEGARQRHAGRVGASGADDAHNAIEPPEHHAATGHPVGAEHARRHLRGVAQLCQPFRESARRPEGRSRAVDLGERQVHGPCRRAQLRREEVELRCHRLALRAAARGHGHACNIPHREAFLARGAGASGVALAAGAHRSDRAYLLSRTIGLAAVFLLAAAGLDLGLQHC